MKFLRSSAISALMAGLCIPAVLTTPAAARDDVPAEVAARENPVGTLSDRDIRYFTKQFKTKCTRCHGPDGSGGGEEAAEQAVPPADLTDTARMGNRTDGQLFYQILMGGGERCAMPAYGPQSSHGWPEEKVWRMVAFVRRLAQPKGE
jgi:mono/diheme cytochrome c family protein